MATILDLARRPVTLIGAFLLAAMLVVGMCGSGGAGAKEQGGLNPAELTAADPSRSDVRTSGGGDPIVRNAPAQTLIERGIRAFEIGRYDDAITLYRAALKAEPRSASAYNLLGMAHRHRYSSLHVPADREQAIAAFQQAVELDPDFVPALVNLGVSMSEEGKAIEAAILIQKALSLDPAHPDRIALSRLAGIEP